VARRGESCRAKETKSIITGESEQDGLMMMFPCKNTIAESTIHTTKQMMPFIVEVMVVALEIEAVFTGSQSF
jgi:hypothetical protein